MEIELLDRYNPYTVPLSSLLVFKEEYLITIILLKCPYLSICILTLLHLENTNQTDYMPAHLAHLLPIRTHNAENLVLFLNPVKINKFFLNPSLLRRVKQLFVTASTPSPNIQ